MKTVRGAQILWTVVVLATTSRIEARIAGARLARRLLGLPVFAPQDLPVPPDLAQAVAGLWIGDNGPIRLTASGDRVAAQLGDSGPTLPLAFQGGTRFVVGDEDVVHFVVEQGHSVLALEYVGGLFDSATRRPDSYGPRRVGARPGNGRR